MSKYYFPSDLDFIKLPKSKITIISFPLPLIRRSPHTLLSNLYKRTLSLKVYLATQKLSPGFGYRLLDSIPTCLRTSLSLFSSRTNEVTDCALPGRVKLVVGMDKRALSFKSGQFPDRLRFFNHLFNAWV